MRKSKNFLVLMLSFVLIAVTFVSPTYSWLSAKSERVVNTFAGGAISIILDEAPVDTDGKEIEGNRVTSNNYKYVAGAVLDKDPTPTVLKGSDSCYVFLCVENELNDLFSLNIDTQSWIKVSEAEGKTLYIYSTSVDASEAEEDVVLNPIFTKVTVSDDLTADDIEALGEKTLCVTAYAVQTEALSSAEAIDLAAAQFMPEGTSSTYVDIA